MAQISHFFSGSHGWVITYGVVSAARFYKLCRKPQIKQTPAMAPEMAAKHTSGAWSMGLPNSVPGFAS